MTRVRAGDSIECEQTTRMLLLPAVIPVQHTHVLADDASADSAVSMAGQ